MLMNSSQTKTDIPKAKFVEYGNKGMTIWYECPNCQARFDIRALGFGQSRFGDSIITLLGRGMCQCSCGERFLIDY